MSKPLWKLPVPSTALLGGGPVFEKRPRRQVAILFSYESEDGDQEVKAALVFSGVEAFKCTYYHSCDRSSLEAYSLLVDREQTPWLAELSANLTRNGDQPGGLVHMMVTFDDGPCYEVVCRSFKVEAI